MRAADPPTVEPPPRRPLVAIVDDDPAIVRLVARLVEGATMDALPCGTGEALLEVEPARLSAVLLDLGLADLDGLEVLRRLHRRDPELPVLIVTAAREVDTAVEAMRAGAYDYVVKPIDARRLMPALQRATERRALTQRVRHLEKTLGSGHRPIVGRSAAIQQTLALVERVRDAEVPVCLRGETGTGKEVVARAIHEGSARARGPFVAVNCASIAESLLESELFGHERGAFTGAAAVHAGCFEQARGGTLLLDEVAELRPAAQASLLRALEERTIRRVGGSADIPIDVRVLSATHRDLEEEVQAGRFRKDLFYRLVVYPIVVPPLRERLDDVPLLVEHILGELAARDGRGPRRIEPDALEALLAHDWPGNVRELQNVVVRARLACDGPSVQLVHLPPALRRLLAPAPPPLPPDDVPAEAGDAAIIPLHELERRQIRRALRATGGNMTRAARLLGIGRATLYRKLEEDEQGAPGTDDGERRSRTG